ncbi:DeoR/GlpR family DNA-binding transcription regulator [Dongia deserti]|uniref:DeoR/GlpR family DNA-binding transcription regulator n=1 Tax=Dongia deserti TaxID=2268030 RepID=UPI002546D58F|nr:DeoR/GlpR family DNA-binding transcription regulator [Dongia deserti]
MGPIHQPGPRQARILELLASRGFLTVREIAAATGVSEITARRDLVELEERKALKRTHGGAMSLRNGQAEIFDAYEPTFDARRRRNSRAKVAIARAAAKLVRSGATIALDVGTSALELARCLIDAGEIKIVTNNLRAAGLLADSPHSVYLPGGRVRGKELSLYGSATANQIRSYWFDLAFIGVSGITESGLFDYSPEDTEIKRIYMERAKRVVVLCDAQKFGHHSMVQVAPLTAVHLLVIDQAPPPALAAALASAGVQLLYA